MEFPALENVTATSPSGRAPNRPTARPCDQTVSRPARSRCIAQTRWHMRRMPLRFALLLLLVAPFFSACSVIKSHLPSTADLVPRKGNAYVAIDLSEQRATLYRSGFPIAGSRVSTGKGGYPTPAGNFRVTQKSKNHRS